MPSSEWPLPCWTITNIDEAIHTDVGAVPQNNPSLLPAVHHPMLISVVRGPSTGGTMNEEILLGQLVDSLGKAGQNTLLPVTGPPGAGKSMLVRWLYAHFRHPDAHVVYVPRELASLRAIVNRLLDEMPKSERVDRVRQEFEKATETKSEQQLANDVLSNIQSILAYGDGFHYGMGILGDSSPATGRTGGFTDWLLDPGVRRHLLRQGGTIQRLIESLLAKRRGGDEEQPVFTSEDVMLSMTARGTLPPATKRADKRVLLQREQAVNLLNEVRDRAVSATLNMQGETTIGAVFQDARRALRAEGKDLVLLFEDLALFGTFQGDIFNQFMEQPKDDLAALRAVYAMTDQKYSDLVPEALREREYQRLDVAPLDLSERALDSVSQFVARYLNVARLGRRPVLDAWNIADKRRDATDWVPNACEIRANGAPCPWLEQCHAAFGTADIGLGQPVGLFPHNSRTLLTLVGKARGAADQPTPRELVRMGVKDLLIESAVDIERGVYPSASAETRFGTTTSRPLPPKVVMAGAAGLSPSERDRVFRARTIWFDGAKESEPFREMLRLPESDQVDQPIAHTPIAQSPVAQSPIADQTLGFGPLRDVVEWQGARRESTDRKRLPQDIVDQARRYLFTSVKVRIDLDNYLVNQGTAEYARLLDNTLKETSFVFEAAFGSPPPSTAMKFTIANDDEGVEFLSGVLWFRDHGHWRFDKQGIKWQPPVYPPGELRSLVEGRLDMWAQQVEERLLRELNVTGFSIAEDVTVLRAVAQMARGTAVADLDIASVVRESRNETEHGELAAATDGLLDAFPNQLLSDFNAYRQGDGGAASVLESAPLAKGLDRVKHDPIGSFRSAANRVGRSPVATNQARIDAPTGLLKAIHDSRTRLLDLHTTMTRLLPRDQWTHQALTLLGRDAADLLDRATQHGLVRPADINYSRAIALFRGLGEGDTNGLENWMQHAPQLGSTGDAGLLAALRLAGDEPWGTRLAGALRAADDLCSLVEHRVRVHAGAGDPVVAFRDLEPAMRGLAQAVDHLAATGGVEE